MSLILALLAGAALAADALSPSCEALVDEAWAGRALDPVLLRGQEADCLRVVRNASFARHGRRFVSEDLKARFEPRQQGLSGSYDDALLTPVDRANVAAVQDVETGRAVETALQAGVLRGLCDGCSLPAVGVATPLCLDGRKGRVRVIEAREEEGPSGALEARFQVEPLGGQAVDPADPTCVLLEGEHALAPPIPALDPPPSAQGPCEKVQAELDARAREEGLDDFYRWTGCRIHLGDLRRRNAVDAIVDYTFELVVSQRVRELFTYEDGAWRRMGDLQRMSAP